MAKAPPPRVRTTELRRRRLVDFVSPAMLAVGAITVVAFIAFILYYRRFEFTWFTAAGNIAVVAVMLLMCATVVGSALHAPRSDPYQTQEDRSKWIKLVVNQALAVCIGVPVLITGDLMLKLLDLQLLEPVIASLVCQVAAAAILWPLYSYRVEEVDFEVYRRDARDPVLDVPGR